MTKGMEPYDAEKVDALMEVSRLRRLICELTFADGGKVFNSYRESVDLARMYPALLDVHRAARSAAEPASGEGATS